MLIAYLQRAHNILKINSTLKPNLYQKRVLPGWVLSYVPQLPRIRWPFSNQGKPNGKGFRILENQKQANQQTCTLCYNFPGKGHTLLAKVPVNRSQCALSKLYWSTHQDLQRSHTHVNLIKKYRTHSIIFIRFGLFNISIFFQTDLVWKRLLW